MKKLLLILIVAFVASSSCKKEDEKYSGSIVFWYGQSTAQALVNANVKSLTFYFDGNIVGSQAASVYWKSAPDCGQNSSVTVKKDLGPVKSKPYDYKVVADNGVTIWSGTKNIDNNICLKLELTQ